MKQLLEDQYKYIKTRIIFIIRTWVYYKIHFKSKPKICRFPVRAAAPLDSRMILTI